jgi:hypothetical protein
MSRIESLLLDANTARGASVVFGAVSAIDLLLGGTAIEAVVLSWASGAMFMSSLYLKPERQADKPRVSLTHPQKNPQP